MLMEWSDQVLRGRCSSAYFRPMGLTCVHSPEDQAQFPSLLYKFLSNKESRARAPRIIKADLDCFGPLDPPYRALIY